MNASVLNYEWIQLHDLEVGALWFQGIGPIKLLNGKGFVLRLEMAVAGSHQELRSF